MLKLLVGNHNNPGVSNNTQTPTTNTVAQSSLQSAPTIPSSGGYIGADTNATSLSAGSISSIPAANSLTFSRSSSYVQIPKFTEGMNFLEFKQKVTVWRKLIPDSIPKNKQGLMLLGELPVKDKFGGLQGIVMDKLSMETLAEDDGIDRLMVFLESRMMEPSFIRLCKWLDKFENFQQKSSWNAERYITEFNKMISQAKSEFSLNIPPTMKAAKLVRACKDLPDEQVGMLTSCLNLEHSEVHVKAEEMIRQFVQNQTGFSKKESNPVKLTQTDVFGNNISDQDSEEAESEEVYFQKTVNKKFKSRKDFDRLRQIAERKGYCSWCYDKNHKKDACPKRKKDLENKKRKILESGKVWYNGDGTVTNPDGTIVPEKKAKKDDPTQAKYDEPMKLFRFDDIDNEECLYDEVNDEQDDTIVQVLGCPKKNVTLKMPFFRKSC